MKRRHLLYLALFLPAIGFTKPKPSHFEYSIIFIGSFENDLVSLSLNNVVVLEKYKVENKDSVKRGHLSLTQYDNEIKVYFNGSEISKAKIPVEFILQTEITINGKLKKTKIDLRKGKVILIDNIDPSKPLQSKNLRIEQIHEPVLLM